MKAARKRYRSRAEREAILAEYVESGLSQGEFSRERGIGLSTMQYWLRKAAEAEDVFQEQTEAGGFVQVKVEELAAINGGERETRAQRAQYEIVLGDGKRLVVRSGFDRREVAELVALLEERPW